MAGEWKRSTWDFSPVALAHTPSHIVKAFHSFLTQVGWELSTWSGVVDDRYYLRSDRFDCNLLNDNTGTAGNVAVTAVGASITVSGMSGGTISVKASGTITLTAVPADGDTITISDGATSKTFEFDSNAAVTGGNISVTIGANRADTLDNLNVAINAAAFNVSSTLNTIWRFIGDGPTQYCGIRVRYVSASSRIEITCFLENSTRTAVQVATPVAQTIFITYSLLVVNSFIMYGGEDGLYFECGRDGTAQNVAHAAIMTFKPIVEFHGSRDLQVQWTTQGLCADLFGSLKFSQAHNERFVDNAGASKNHTGYLGLIASRGTSSILASTQADAPLMYFAPRDNYLGRPTGSGGNLANYLFCSLGMINSPLDDRYKISPFWVFQNTTIFEVGVSSALASNNVAVSAGYHQMLEARWLRQIDRFAAVDQTLIPFNNITDQITGKVYRVTRVADTGRNSNLGIEFPATTVTIPTTPSV